MFSLEVFSATAPPRGALAKAPPPTSPIKFPPARSLSHHTFISQSEDSLIAVEMPLAKDLQAPPSKWNAAPHSLV